MTTTPQTPFERLRAVLLPRERLAVALSGGLDSSVLLAAAVRILGADHCLALTARTPYVMEEEVRDSTALCRRLGVRQEKLAFPILPALANNPPLRCYLCKHALFSSLAARAAEMGGKRFCCPCKFFVLFPVFVLPPTERVAATFPAQLSALFQE